jgi:hypothetical protein
MRKAIVFTVLLVPIHFAGMSQIRAAADRLTQEIVALERSALDRWIRLSIHGTKGASMGWKPSRSCWSRSKA